MKHAIVYRGREVSLYRDGEPYAHYTMAPGPQLFGPQAIVMFGRRHLDVRDMEHSFAGRIKDARIYAEPLDQKTIAGLVPGRAAEDLKPWAWWTFADEGLREKTGRYNQIQLSGNVFSDGGQASFKSVTAWEMAPANPY